MRKLLWTILILFSLSSFSQKTSTDSLDLPLGDKTKRNEIAFCLAGGYGNSGLMFSEKNVVVPEVLNGVLFRHKINKFSLRGYASFAKQRYNKEYPLNTSEVTYGWSEATDYRIGTGIQFNLIKQKDFIYTYLDMGYKRRHVDGLIVNWKDTSGTFTNYHSNYNGVDFNFGIGAKFKLFKNIFFFSELGYYSFISQSKTEYVDIHSQNETSARSPYNFQTYTLKFYLSIPF